MRTQVGIIGAGPAGLLLSHLLHQRGIDSVVLEARSREYVERRVRAGVLEQGTVNTLIEAGVGDRMLREGLVHQGIELRFDGVGHRIAFEKHVPGRAITVYGQQEVVKDLIAARLAAGGDIRFDVLDVAPHDMASAEPYITFEDGRIDCEIIAGCDGFHGVSRESIPDGVLTTFSRDYPFAWLGVLAAVKPSADELIYSMTDRGFALHSMRSPELSRFYLQVPVDTLIEDWSDERIWAQLKARLEPVPGFTLATGEVIEKSVTPMRSFVAEPMRYERLFLAGDAAHIVPPTGAKGMNLAIADIRVLTAALTAYFKEDRTDLLDAYSETCLRKVLRAHHFSWWMTTLLHRMDDDDSYDHRLHTSYLNHVTSYDAAATTLAEHYVGMR